jgi:hypothetical protein
MTEKEKSGLFTKASILKLESGISSPPAEL